MDFILLKYKRYQLQYHRDAIISEKLATAKTPSTAGTTEQQKHQQQQG
jgi:hypothetical protein